MASAPIVLVPGFWLGAWAWDEVADSLRADGHDVTALTLPGLESADADRSAVTMADHVGAITAAVQAVGAPVVLAVHSGTGFPGYTASDRIPEQIAAMVYVDSAPGIGAMNPGFEGVEMPLPSPEELAEEENLDGLSEEQLETFRQRAVPQPGGVLREAAALTNDARRDIPSTIICTGFSVGAGEGLRRGAQPGLARRPRRAQRRHLDRPADEPLADVVTPGRARRHHRRPSPRLTPPDTALDRAAERVAGEELLLHRVHLQVERPCRRRRAPRLDQKMSGVTPGPMIVAR